MAKDLNVSLGLLTENFKKGLKSAKRDLNRFARQTEQVGSTLTRSLSIPLGGAAVAAVKSAADFEKLEKQLTSVTGSADATQQQIESLKKIAEAPGLGFEQAVRASARLQAVGLNAADAEAAIREFGNAVARSGGGAVEFDGAILALTQIASKGKISAEEINQLNERIFEIRPALERAFGTSSSEELQKLGISSEEFISKVTAEFAKLDRVQGGLANAFENLGIGVKSFAADIGGVITDLFPVQDIVERITTGLDNLSTSFKNLSKPAQRSIIQFGAIAAAIGPVLLAISGLARGLASLTPALLLVTNTFRKAAGAAIRFYDGITALPGVISSVRSGSLSMSEAFSKLSPRLAAAVKAFRAFNLVTKISIIGAVVVGITALAAAFQALRKRAERANAVNRIFNKVSQEATQSIIAERSAVDRLVKIAQDETRSKNDRIKALERLQQISPKYFSDLSLEEQSLERLTQSQKNFNEELLRQAKIKAAEEQLVEIQKELQNAQALFEEGKPTFLQTAGNAALTLGNSVAFAGRQINTQTKNIAANVQALRRQEQALLKTLEANQKVGEIGGGTVTTPSITPTTPIGEVKADITPLISSTLQAEQRINTMIASFNLAFDTLKLKTEPLKQDINEIGLRSQTAGDLAAEGFNRASEELSASINRTNILTSAQKRYNQALGVSQILADKLSGTFDGVFTAISKGQNAFKAFRDGLKQVVLDLIKAAAKAAIFAAITSIIFPGAGSFKGVFSNIFSQVGGFKLPKLASGGIVTRSTIANVGEDGAEAIIPLDRINEFRGGQELQLRVEGTELVALLKNSEDIYNRLY